MKLIFNVSLYLIDKIARKLSRFGWLKYFTTFYAINLKKAVFVTEMVISNVQRTFTATKILIKIVTDFFV